MINKNKQDFIGISVTKGIKARIDNLRGDVPRSKYIEKMLIRRLDIIESEKSDE